MFCTLCIAFCLLGELVAESRYVEEYPHAACKKGLQVEMVDDALVLGVKHAALNVNLSQLVDPSRNTGEPSWQSGGETFHFKASALRNLDRQIKALSDRGVIVNLVILAYRSGNEEIDRLMLHPEYDPAAPNQLGAFNCSTVEGRKWFVATLEFLAERWSRPDREHGRAVGYIIGNEVNVHWWWSNRGKVSFDEFAADYVRTVRLAHGAVRRQSSCARVYLSLDHHWNMRHGAGDDRQSFAGRRLVDYFADKGADFDWHLAYHPYPENLFEPRFWNDSSASGSPDTQRITFKNLEVLTDYFARDELLYEGNRRKIILSEQGFHTPGGADGEELQAAAYCYAYRLVAALEGIDSFILHRHVDHPHEGGLRLGLRRRDGDARPKKRIYECFRRADQEDWREAFAFALPRIGLEAWPAEGGGPKVESSMRYIENDFVKLGVNMQAGGAIGYFALLADQRNLLNHHDRGRFIQQSYYGDEDGSRWNRKPWRWNPVQGGDWRGKPAVVLKSYFEKEELAVTTRPRHWASGELIQDAEMKMHVKLNGPMAHVDYSFEYNGDHQHKREGQELPAVFVDYALKNLVFYRGKEPWKKQPLVRTVPGWPNEYHDLTESWCAYVDDHDWGLGIYTDDMRHITCYRYRSDERTGPNASACSYLAPVEQMKIGPGFRFGYQAAIIIGQIDDIRSRFYTLHAERTRLAK